jgi:hypothetical protein
LAAFSFLDDKDSLLGDSNIKKGTMSQEIKPPKELGVRQRKYGRDE